MNMMTLAIDSSTIDALKDAISHHNDAAAVLMSSDQYNTARQAKATSKLTQVLRTCQKIIGRLDDRNCLQSSSSKVVHALLERCMNTQDLYGNEEVIHPRCRNTTTMTSSSSSTGNVGTTATTLSGPHQIGNRNCGSTLPPQESEGDQANPQNHEGDLGFLYSKPIRISSEFYDSQVIFRCGIPNICMFLSCAATFNLALVHQLLAQDRSTEELRKRSRGLLAKATRLYEICLTLISDESHQQQEQDQQSFTYASIFGLATSNNLGMALEQLNESENAQQYFTLTLSNLMCLICRTTTPGRATIMGQTILPCSADIDGFFRTASRVMSHEKAAPAA